MLSSTVSFIADHAENNTHLKLIWWLEWSAIWTCLCALISFALDRSFVFPFDSSLSQSPPPTSLCKWCEIPVQYLFTPSAWLHLPKSRLTSMSLRGPFPSVSPCISPAFLFLAHSAASCFSLYLFFCPQSSIIFTSSLLPFIPNVVMSSLSLPLFLSLALKCFTCLIGLFRRRAHYLQLEGAECRIMGNIWGLISAACLKGNHHCAKSHTNTLTHTDRDSTTWQPSAKAFQLGSCFLTC